MLSILVNLFGSSKRSADALDNDACTTGPPAQRLRLASSSAAPPTPTRTVPSAFRGPVRLAVVKPRRTHSDIDLMFPNTLVHRLDLSANRLQWAVNEKTPSLIDVLYHVNSVEDLWTCLRFSTAAEGQIAAVKIVITPNGALTKRSAARSILTHISNSEGCRVTSLVVVVAPGHVQYLDPLPDEINLPMLKELDINPRLIVRVADMGANPEYFRSTKLYTTLYGVLRARLQRDAIDVQLCVIYAFANIRTVRLGTPFDVKGHMSSPFLPRLQRLELDLTSGWQAKNIHDVQLWLPAPEIVWCGRTTEHAYQMSGHLASAFSQDTTATMQIGDVRSVRFNTIVLFENRWIRVEHHTIDDRWSVEVADCGLLRRIEGLLRDELNQLLEVVPGAKLVVWIEAGADAKALQGLTQSDMSGLAAVAFQLSPSLPGGTQLQRIRREVNGRLGSVTGHHAVVDVHLWSKRPTTNILPMITQEDKLELASGFWSGTTNISVADTVQVFSPVPSPTVSESAA